MRISLLIHLQFLKSFSKNLLNKIGGKDYLISLATETPTAANLEAMLKLSGKGL